MNDATAATPAAAASSAAFQDREADPRFSAPRVAFTLSDFELIRRLGDGSFAQVVLARHKHSNKQYAIKIIDKHLILRHKQTKYIKNERFLLDKINYDGICDLRFTFQDQNSLYLGLELCPNGELYDQIQKRKQMDVQDARFYAAEIVLMLQRLRQEKVIHRDLKPENLLLDAKGHLKLIDFGSAKYLGEGSPNDVSTESDLPNKSTPKANAAGPSDSSVTGSSASKNTSKANLVASLDIAANSSNGPTSSSKTAEVDAAAAQPVSIHMTGTSAAVPQGMLPSKSLGTSGELGAQAQAEATSGVSQRSASQRATSFVGTADYVAPETLNNQPVTYAADLWALGCVLYQMLLGKPPFKAATEYLTFQLISAGQLDLPASVPANAQDLLRRLLNPDASQRIGAANIQDLMKHTFFEKLDWENLRKQTPPKFIAVKKSTADEDAFDWELASLKGQHHGQFGDMGAGHAAAHANAAGSQDSSGNDAANANAFMAAVAMHAIVTAENQAHGEW